MKILIVEDDQSIQQSIENYLKDAKHTVELASDFECANDKVSAYEYDLVLLDISLPGGSGLDILKTLKEVNPETGVLILSAKDSLDDRLTGLDIGADDYLTKPFHLSELNSRINAIYRRRFKSGSELLIFNEYSLDTRSNVVCINNHHIELSKKEYDLLLYFITNSHRVLTKSAVAEHIWGDYMDMADSHDLVYSHIKNLRRKINKYAHQDYIKTVYGMGYKWTDKI